MMRSPVVALSVFSLLLAADPALARGKSSQRHVHASDHHAARPLAKVRHHRNARVHHRAGSSYVRWRARSVETMPAAGPRWHARGPREQYGSFSGDERYPVQRAIEPGGWAPMARADAAVVRHERRGRISAPLDGMIARHAQMNGVPEALVRRVVMRESGGNPRAIGRGGAMGLMQIKTATARAMGYGGSAAGLLDAETNMTYAVRYLAGAYRVAGGNHDRAVSHYARGYYYAAKRVGLSPYRRPDWQGAYATY